MSDDRSVRCDVRGPIATVTLDRPEGRNAMTAHLVRQAYEVLTELGGRDDGRIVELTGSGDRFFCPGADLGGRDDNASRVEVRHLRVPVLLHEMPQLTIAAINGSCAGAGLGWACGCDLRIATASARFNTAFLDVGVAGDMGLPWSLSAIVGSARLPGLKTWTLIGAVRSLIDGVNPAEASVQQLSERDWPH